MTARIILASGSDIRAKMLTKVGVKFEVEKPRVDEEAIRQSLEADGAIPRDVADALAEAKARRISAKHPGALVIGSDQILDLNGEIISKPTSPEALLNQMKKLGGKTHKLISAAVLYEDAKPVWRHINEARMSMHVLSDTFLTNYIERNWADIRHSVGGYMIEAEGARLFSRVHGDPFTIMGLPLLELVSYLALRGEVDT